MRNRFVFPAVPVHPNRESLTHNRPSEAAGRAHRRGGFLSLRRRVGVDPPRQGHLPRWIASQNRAGLLFLVMGCTMGMCLLSAACRQDAPPTATTQDKPTGELVIITPHDRAIREAFDLPFSLWYEKKSGEIVTIRWIYRGTLEAQDYILSQFERDPSGRQSGVDVFFGGGTSVHRDLAERGYSQPVQVSEPVLTGIPKELNGQPLYAEDGSWHGTALGGFGILYNKRAAEARGLPMPHTWADLASPPYQGWVAAANPAASGSTTQCLVLATLKHGWTDGWGIIMGLAANCDGLLPSSGLIGPNVTSGVAVAGLEPEFVARMMMSDAPETLDYVNPAGATAITPDPVTVLKGAKNEKAAEGFVEFVLSADGQRLWALPADAGGPATPLYRYPIRAEVYEKYGEHLVVKGNPLKEQTGMRIDPQLEAAYTRLLPVLLEAACGRNHFLMQQAWSAARKEPSSSDRLAVLRTPLFDEQAALRYAEEVREPQRARELVAAWSQAFRQRYESILGTPPATATAER